MILCGRVVDMSVHMEMYLQDLLPRKGDDRTEWQPVDISMYRILYLSISLYVVDCLDLQYFNGPHDVV
jgi:hypothetical protein